MDTVRWLRTRAEHFRAKYDESASSELNGYYQCNANRLCEAADEIVRLRAENAAWQNQGLLEQCNRQADENERLRAALATARNDALEEAAKRIEQKAAQSNDDCGCFPHMIRALKDGRAMPEPPASDASETG